MKSLSINLTQDYKSFKNGFVVELRGNLIILSGVNGSGKSQLIDIIAQRESHGNKKAISATVKLDAGQISRNDVLRRTFKENVNVPELTHAGTETITSHKNNAWNAYNNYFLNFQNEHLWDYEESSERAKQILVEEYGEQKFNNKQITQAELKDALPSDFVWKSDDIFTNFIGELFFNYALDVYDAKAESGEAGTKFDPSTLSEPPWKQLNNLFSELEFEYRFKDDYFVKNLQINEQPLLFQIKSDGMIDENESRKLADLSDGEKAIISLSFASLSGVKCENRKVLLLDEFDANFNPSLTEIFYKIIDQHFVSKGILVVIATHSPTTISLAPDTASFYEVFKSNSSSSDRILPVQKDAYAELEIANKAFYTRIADQSARIAELEQEKTESQARLSELSGLTKPSLFVEGDIDIQYLNKAAELNTEWKEILDKVEIKEKNGKGGLSKYWKNRLQIKEFLKYPVILLFDCDTGQSDEKDALIYKRCITLNQTNSIKKGIENLFTDALILKAEKTASKKFTQKSIPNVDEPNNQQWIVTNDEKKNLVDWICINAEKDDFANFSVIFNLIKSVLDNVNSN
ncbi:TPA: hypothetical protein DCP13_02360 [Candidatus Azambacteria bacterium]|uniref:AAA+ ATPase domain-containing protein n=3 Tax=Candidatus Azamiibacteriota TaxID=1752741 RepID=A0A0G1SF15_9BACT|nr:MAG: hypothetical protein UX33_C0045G0009 [Candidatus Azambacteria bacterium GW2011_GWC1_46_13]KKU32536.1 MAG: hypothetical protein UX48_C0054G0002 [Candidatus Azambacteria bacterium GW2011_GWB1_46_27]KKU40643.1 MAG: hypothetical protein UX56_C0029G0010 [Candidatus Azambacteria bacterium GW2011_GWD2_46_48]HAQ05618.1 hypothetical protein [Candidatus Azambacteria bacterium]HBC59500.1 hypothetical protein [Candidatus Azambacteria bacterium]